MGYNRPFLTLAYLVSNTKANKPHIKGIEWRERKRERPESEKE
jgi:hypothetical protein